MQILAVLGIAVGIPAWLCRALNHPANIVPEGGVSTFTPAAERATLQRRKPQWVLIGNSMLNSRIDHAALSEVSGWRTRKVAKGGSQSALWFLFLKYIVIESGATPALVTIFFRDTDLTWPEFRIEGNNEQLIAELRGPEQPEWKLVLIEQRSAAAGVTGVIRDGLNAVFPTDQLHEVARRQMQNRAFRATRIGTKDGSSLRRIELNARFSLAHLRRDLGGDFAASGEAAALPQAGVVDVADPTFYEDGPSKFDSAPEVSFLPHIVELGRQHGIQLHFHRVKRRPLPDDTRPDSKALVAYMAALKAYLEEQGCFLTDETADRLLTLDMYADGDHISTDEPVQQRYLANFWERVRPVVQRMQRAQANPAP